MIGYKDKTLKYDEMYFNRKLKLDSWSYTERAKGKLKCKFIYWSKC